MGDVAQILGLGSSSGSTAVKLKQSQSAAGDSRSMKVTGMPKEVMKLIGGKQDAKSAALPPAIPSSTLQPAAIFESKSNNTNSNIGSAAATVKVGNKLISTKKAVRKWVWAPFASSARTDGLMLRHWVRAEVEYPDYPYARFDIHLDPVTYTDDEYRLYLQDDTWTKSETDQLMELVRRFELRWPVIYDRWLDAYYLNLTMEDESSSTPSAADRKIEDLQHRYYSVAATLTQTRISQEAAAETQSLIAFGPDPSKEDQKVAAENLVMETASARAIASSEPQNQPLVHNLGTGSSNKVFDLNYERERRAHMELLWNRTKAEEEEESDLRKELRMVEAQLRKLKKMGGHILAANNTGSTGAKSGVMASTASSWGQSSRSVSPTPGNTAAGDSAAPAALLDQCFASTAPTPMAETPYLQSGRLVPPATGGPMGLNKTLLNRMEAVLSELKIPAKPIPTKRVCDLYDAVRKDILTLLTLQKMVLQKEGQVQTKRVKLAKMGGNIRVVDEDTLLGISNSTSAGGVANSSSNRAKGARSGKGKATSTAGNAKAKAAVSKAKAAVTGADDGNTKLEAKDNTQGGGKPAPKKTVKRKRKSDSKSPTNAPAAAPSTTSGVSGESTSPVPSQGADAAGGKGGNKKRARKNAQS